MVIHQKMYWSSNKAAGIRISSARATSWIRPCITFAGSAGVAQYISRASRAGMMQRKDQTESSRSSTRSSGRL